MKISNSNRHLNPIFYKFLINDIFKKRVQAFHGLKFQLNFYIFFYISPHKIKNIFSTKYKFSVILRCNVIGI